MCAWCACVRRIRVRVAHARVHLRGLERHGQGAGDHEAGQGEPQALFSLASSSPCVIGLPVASARLCAASARHCAFAWEVPALAMQDFIVPAASSAAASFSLAPSSAWDASPPIASARACMPALRHAASFVLSFAAACMQSLAAPAAAPEACLAASLQAFLAALSLPASL